MKYIESFENFTYSSMVNKAYVDSVYNGNIATYQQVLIVDYNDFSTRWVNSKEDKLSRRKRIIKGI